jgi:ribosomal protein S6--L-glutamate ligase
MRFCFIVEEQYRRSPFPMGVADHLRAADHEVVLLEPHAGVADLNKAILDSVYDAFVLRTYSSGPGLSLLEAASEAGITTINDARAIRRVRDKVVAAAVARARDLPFPSTSFVANPGLLEQVPEQEFPLVVKPSKGGWGQGIHLLQNREDARSLDWSGPDGHYLVAQPWVSNSGYDIKLYNTGRTIYAVRRRSPLFGPREEPDELFPLTPALRRLAERVGRAFGLDIYGVDVVHGPEGWVVVDVNDFPSFPCRPDAVAMVTSTIIDIARSGRRQWAEAPLPVREERPA